MNKVWKTEDGRTIEFRWMQSQHLVHAINLVLRTNNIDSEEWDKFKMHRTIGLGLQEIEHRGLNVWTSTAQLSVPSVRETPIQLCMLRALLDGRPRPSRENVNMFYANPDEYIEAMQQHRNEEGISELWARFVAYRVTHGNAS